MGVAVFTCFVELLEGAEQRILVPRIGGFQGQNCCILKYFRALDETAGIGIKQRLYLLGLQFNLRILEIGRAHV